MKKEISQIRDSLSCHLSLNKARAKCLSLMIVALFKCCTINLQRLSESFGTSNKISSDYRRLQRFFNDIIFDSVKLGLCILSILGSREEKFVITIDRTNWLYGKNKINYLTIAIVYQGLSIPIIFENLDKKGSSNSAERIVLMEKLLKIIPPERIKVVLADREFIGKEWFKYLKIKKIPYAIRIKDNIICHLKDGSSALIKRHFKSLKKGKSRVIENCKICGFTTNLKARRNRKGELIVIAYSDDIKECPIELYRQRWSIECMFRNMKKKGFNLEDTHMTDGHKLETLFGVLAISFAWAVKIGEIRTKIKNIRTIKNKGAEFNLFSYGKQAISNIINRDNNHILFKKIIIPFKQIFFNNKRVYKKRDLFQFFVVG
jgi:hypothetical protein